MRLVDMMMLGVLGALLASGAAVAGQASVGAAGHMMRALVAAPECALTAEETARIVPLGELQRSMPLVQHCLMPSSAEDAHAQGVFELRTESNCVFEARAEDVRARGIKAQWVTHPAFAAAHEAHVAASASAGKMSEADFLEQSYMCTVADAMRTAADPEQADEPRTWLLRHAHPAEHVPDDVPLWEAALGTAVHIVARSDVASGRQLYVTVFATPRAVARLQKETDFFEYAQPLPDVLRMSPSVFYAAMSHEAASAASDARMPAAASEEQQLHVDLMATSAVRVPKAELHSMWTLHRQQQLQQQQQQHQDVARVAPSAFVSACNGASTCRLDVRGMELVDTTKRVAVRDVPHMHVLRAAQDMLHQVPQLAWIDVGQRQRVFNNNGNTLIQGGSQSDSDTPFWDEGLTGSGQVVGCADSGLDHESCFFYDSGTSVTFSSDVFSSNNHRKVRRYTGFADTVAGENTDHGTHVVGSVLGESNTQDAFNGVAKDAKVSFYDIGVAGQPFLDVPASIETSVFPDAYDVGARVHTNSWGSNTNGYTNYAQDVDAYSYDHQDYLVLVAAGNSGNQLNSIGSPATAKSALAVCASENNKAHSSIDVATFSSRGYTSDGRNKPEICAPGFSVTSANSQANPTPNHCSTVSLAGTSMATPLTAGLSALVRQYFEEGFYPSGSAKSSDEFTPMGSLVRAMIINAGQYMDGNQATLGSDLIREQGYGLIDMSKTATLGSSGPDMYVIGEYDDDSPCKACPKIFNTGGLTDKIKIQLKDSASTDFKVTLVWADYVGSQSSTPHGVNDLDLRVELNGAGQFLSVNDLGVDTPDTLNSVEQVWLDSNSNSYVQGGEYHIQVYGSSVTFTQPFALVITGDFKEIEETTEGGNGGGSRGGDSSAGDDDGDDDGSSGGLNGGETAAVVIFVLLGVFVAAYVGLRYKGYISDENSLGRKMEAGMATMRAQSSNWTANSGGGGFGQQQQQHQTRPGQPVQPRAVAMTGGAAPGSSWMDANPYFATQATAAQPQASAARAWQSQPAAPSKPTRGGPNNQLVTPNALPRGWEEVHDPQSGQMYFWQPSTDTVTWQRPMAGRSVV